MTQTTTTIRVPKVLVHPIENLREIYKEAMEQDLDEEDFLILLNEKMYTLGYDLIAQTPKKRFNRHWAS
jgi:hypothetical protein